MLESVVFVLMPGIKMRRPTGDHWEVVKEKLEEKVIKDMVFKYKVYEYRTRVSKCIAEEIKSYIKENYKEEQKKRCMIEVMRKYDIEKE